MESRTQGSRPRPRPRTQKKSEAKAKDSLSEDRHSRGQGQECSRPRTGMLEAKAKDQGHKRKCSPKQQKKRSSQKFFRRSPKNKNKKKRTSQKFFRRSPKNKNKKKGLHKNFSSDLHKKRFPKNFSSASQNFNNSKNSAVLEPRTGQFSRTWGLEAKAKDLTFEAKAKDFKMCPRGLHLWSLHYYSPYNYYSPHYSLLKLIP